MIISKKSWHYRLLKWYHIEPAKNLCIYFWQVVFGLILPIIFIFNTAIIIYVTINNTIVVIFSLLVSTIIVLLLQYVIPTLYFKYFYKHNTPKPKKTNKPNLTLEFIKAKKQKICPILEWEN